MASVSCDVFVALLLSAETGIGVLHPCPGQGPSHSLSLSFPAPGTTLVYSSDPTRRAIRYTWINYRLDVFGNTFSLYSNGRLFNRFVDTTPGPTQGTVGFWAAHNRYTYFERLRVRDRALLVVGSGGGGRACVLGLG
jgi:hypothetical protein